MIQDERRNQILNICELKGFVSLQELADELDASESTIRRDLEYLDGLGQVRRARGGAVFVGESLKAFEDRTSDNSAVKQRIAEVAANLIEPGEAVILDGGTTTFEVARKLAHLPLMVVTNSLAIANLMAGHSHIELTMIGGYVYPKTGVSLGPVAVEALKCINVRKLIMSVGGITEKGLYNSNNLLVETERQMMDSADEVIVVADHQKFGHSALAHLCSLDRMDRLVVDRDLSEEWKDKIRQHGVELIEEK